jgi:hypothetical protein
MEFKYVPTEWGPIPDLSPEESFYYNLLGDVSDNSSSSFPLFDFIPLSESGIIDKYESLDLDEPVNDPGYSRRRSSGGKKESWFKDQYIKAVGGVDKYYDFFSEIARVESGYTPDIQNLSGAPAYGLFQFWEDGRVNNISTFAGVDINTFLNDPILQIQSARRLANSFLSQFTNEDFARARELGYSESALLAGAWCGGVNGVRNLLHYGKNASDRHWNKNGHGTSVKERMDLFNNMF